MNQPIKILLLEDSIYDAELTLHELRRQGVKFEYQHAKTRDEFLVGLKQEPDIILVDYSLPQFNAREALALMHKEGYDIPVLVISGTIGEDLGVDMMKRGALDYLMKDRLGRLSSAIQGAIEAGKLRSENKQYMSQLEESNARYKSIFDNSPISLWEEDFSQVKIFLEKLSEKGVTDFHQYFNENHDELVRLTRSRGIIAINQATVDLYEAENKETAIRELGNIFSEQSIKQFQEYAIAFFHGETEYRAQAEHITTRGNRIFVSVNIAIAPGYRETWERVLISVLDLTQQANAQQQVIQSEYLLRSMIDSSLDWIFVKDTDHRYLLANKTFTKGFGLQEEEIIGKTDEEIGFSKKTSQELHEEDHRIINSGKPESFYDKRITREDGQQLHFSTIKSPLYNNEGKIWGIMGISRDISERLRRENELNESRRNYEALFDSLVDGLLIFKMDGKILVANPVANLQLGFEPGELVGKNITEILPEEETHGVYKDRIEKLMKDRHMSVTLKHLLPSGDPIPLEVNANLVEFQGQHAILAIMRDISEIVEAENALKNSEIQYRLLFDTVPDVIILSEFSGKIVHVNFTTCELTGYQYQELMQLSMQDLSQNTPELFDKDGNISNQAEERKLTMELKTKSEEIRLLDITIIHTEFDGHTVAMIVGRDQTDRILAERRTAETEILLRTVIETIPQPIFVYDDEARYVIINKNMSELYQMPKEDFIGKTNIDLAKEGIISTEEAKAYHENAMIPLMTKEPFTRPLDTFIDPDGIQHWFQIFTVPLKLPDNTLWVVGAGNEITHQLQARSRLEALNEVLERRVEDRTKDLDRANAELQKAKEQIESMLQYSPDGFLLLDPDLNIQIMNPAFVDLIGVDPEIVIGSHALTIVGDRNKDLIGNALRDAIDTNQTVSVEHKAAHVNGTEFDCLTSITPIFSEDGLSGIVIGVHDITPQKDVQRMKDAFVSNVSHELRTPITNFICNLELIRMNPQKQDVYLKRLDLEIVQLKNIIEDLLRLSRFDQNATSIASAPFDLNIMCEEFTSLRTPLAEQKNLSLAFIPDENLPKAMGDYGLISQVLSILLTNAINYTQENGEIIIRTHGPDEKHPAMVGFSVSDNGPGITPEEKEKIFERFYRGKAAVDTNVSGTGLGLPIAYEIISRHEGEIKVISSGVAGEGTTFFVWLPYSTDEQ